MYKFVLTIGLVAALAGCTKRDAKVEQASQVQTASAPVANPDAMPAQASNPVPAPAEAANPAETVTAPAPSEPVRPIAIPAGTRIRVRLEQTIDTRRNRPGDRFEATLVSPVYVDGNTLLPGGTQFVGHVTEARHSGRFKGRAVLGVELDSFSLNGAVYRVATAPDTRVSGRHRKRNWILMGGGSGVGASIGAIAGGGPGALIGAGAGAGAGAVGAFFTGRKDVRLPVETSLTFRLRTDVALTNS